MGSTTRILDAFLKVADGELFVRRWSPSTERHRDAPIVLLHDSLGCVEMWRTFPSMLAERLGREIIAYDRMGYGQSSRIHATPALSFIDDEAVVLSEVCSQLEQPEVILLGHSVGGGMALSAASQMANRKLIKAVITVSAQAFVEKRTTDGITAAKHFFGSPANLSKLEKFHGERSKWVLDAWTESWLHPKFADWSLGSHLPRVRVPVLAIHGEQDEYGSCQFPEMIANGVSGTSEKVILEGCGHVPHRERPEEVIGFVSDFIDRNTYPNGQATAVSY